MLFGFVSIITIFHIEFVFIFHKKLISYSLIYLVSIPRESKPIYIWTKSILKPKFKYVNNYIRYQNLSNDVIPHHWMQL